MKRNFLISAIVVVMILAVVGFLQASGIVPAIVPAGVPAANRNGSLTPGGGVGVFQLAASNTPGSAGSSICDDGNGNSTVNGCLGTGIYSQATSVTVTNTLTETSIINTTGAKGTITLPANFFSASGVALRVRLWGIHTASANPTIRWQVKIGGTTILDTTAVTTQTSTNQAFDVDGVITCRTTGVTGTVVGQGKYIEVGNALFPMSNTGTQTINTTIANNVDITITWGTASVSDSITATNVLLEGNFGSVTQGSGGSGAVTQISKQTLVAPAASITFSSIPSTFNNLMFTLMSRSDQATTQESVGMTFNGDAAAHYDREFISGFNAVVSSGQQLLQTSIIFTTLPGSTSPAGSSSASSTRIFNYTNTTFWKESTTMLSGTNPDNANMAAFSVWGDWQSTAAITSITLAPAAGNFVTGTVAILYGEN